MKSVIWMLVVLAVGFGSASAAQIDLQNAVDGSASVTMSPAATADVNLVIITNSLDTIQVCFVNAFLDASNDDVDVVAVTGGQAGWTYDRSAFQLPAEIDQTGGNEYGLVTGDSDGSSALPLGNATHILDIITLETDAESGSTSVAFEPGARQPQVFGPPPTYVPFIIHPTFPNFPNFLYVGDSGGANSPFIINYIPEPMTVIPILVAIASACLIKPRGLGTAGGRL